MEDERKAKDHEKMWQSEIERKKERQGMQQTRVRDEKHEEAVKEHFTTLKGQKERLHHRVNI